MLTLVGGWALLSSWLGSYLSPTLVSSVLLQMIQIPCPVDTPEVSVSASVELKQAEVLTLALVGRDEWRSTERHECRAQTSQLEGAEGKSLCRQPHIHNSSCIKHQASGCSASSSSSQSLPLSVSPPCCQLFPGNWKKQVHEIPQACFLLLRTGGT